MSGRRWSFGASRWARSRRSSARADPETFTMVIQVQIELVRGVIKVGESGGHFKDPRQADQHLIQKGLAPPCACRVLSPACSMWRSISTLTRPSRLTGAGPDASRAADYPVGYGPTEIHPPAGHGRAAETPPRGHPRPSPDDAPHASIPCWRCRNSSRRLCRWQTS